MADHALAPSYLEGDYGTASGERCVRALLALEEVPTVIVFDNDAMAIGGADALHRLGVDVPGDISVVSWDDSLSCQTYDPPLAVLGHRAPQLGTELGTAAIALLAGDSEAMRRVAEIPRIVPRGSLAATG
ncbi:substrate-binding domain-containing protein [Brachybacterium alimentarium]|nr:substrate-binding domain-containing protein [Brachybacterium alimentarium]